VEREKEKKRKIKKKKVYIEENDATHEKQKATT
jgi:hypothetical protein